MSLLFCTDCCNLLSVITTSDEYYCKCIKCQKIFQPTEIDMMLSEEVRGANLITYKTILQHSGQDPVNPKIRKQCTKCPCDILKQMRSLESMQLINTCVKCNHQWLECSE